MQIAEADDIAVGLDGVQNPVRPGKRLNQTVHFKILVHPERVERRRVKACQEHIDHDEQIDLPRLNTLGQVFVVVLELVRRRVKIDVEHLVIPLYSHSFLSICPISCLIFPYITCLLYFGANTI